VPISSRIAGSSIVGGMANCSPSVDDRRLAEARHSADFVAHHLDDLLDDVLVRPVDAGLQHHEADRHLAFQFVVDADHRALGDVLVLGKDFLHAAGREAVAGDVDEVVGATHDVDVAVLVEVAGIARLVVAGVVGHVAVDEALAVVPQGRKARGRQGQLDADIADLAVGQLLVGIAQDVDGVARHGLGRRAVLDREAAQAQAVRRHGPAGLGLPPVVDDRAVEHALGPLHGVGIGALAGQEQGDELREIVPADPLAPGVLLLDRAEGGGRGEQRLDAVVGDDAPEDAGIGRAHGLALEHHRRVAVEQRRIDHVAVAHDPADVACRPPAVAGVEVVDPLHRPVHRHHVAAVVADHALGLTRRAGGVEDVERVGRRNRHPVDRAGARHLRVPVVVAPGLQLGGLLPALQHDNGLGLVPGDAEALLQDRHVGDDAAGLDAAARGDDQARRRIVQALGDLGRGKAAEDHRVDGADAGAGEHGDDRLGHRRHVDQHPVALLHLVLAQHPGEGRDLLLQFGEGQRAAGAGDRAFPDDGALVAPARLDMAVDRVPAGVGLCADEPVGGGRLGGIKNLVPALRPGHGLGQVAPVARRILDRTAVGLVVRTRHALLLP
jgi:hypothetical protein